MIAFLAAAAAFAAPFPIDADKWFEGFGAHPPGGSLTLIASEIVVNPEGKVVSCSARPMLGIREWGPFTCALIQLRGRFRPAKIGDEPVWGLYRLRNAWVQSGYPPADLPVWDFELEVSKAPDGVKLPLLRKIQFVVDQQGKITACSPRGEWSAALAALACGELSKALTIKPLRTLSGEAVPSVQDATVRFVAASGPKV
jgi:hypothetical protein